MSCPTELISCGENFSSGYVPPIKTSHLVLSAEEEFKLLQKFNHCFMKRL